MDEKTREAVQYSMSDIIDMMVSMTAWAKELDIAIAYSDREFPEDIELQIDELCTAVGFAFDAFAERRDDILRG